MNCEIENKINICTGLVATAIFKKHVINVLQLFLNVIDFAFDLPILPQQ